MASSPRLAIALLAAGRSERFGVEDKLGADLAGKPLGLHAAGTLARCDADRRWVIASRADHPCSAAWRAGGWDIAVNSRASEGMGTSVALAAGLAEEHGADLLLIALADMPLVPLAHFEALVAAARNRPEDALAATSTGTVRMPPACFGKARFASLAVLDGDEGARRLLSGAISVTCAADALVDVDVPDTLDRLRERLRGRPGCKAPE
jgi:CTP:molybdopterin cytidylyltransferase MocA